MKLNRSLAASVAPFAHLLGLGASASRAEDDDDDKKASRRAEESEEDDEDDSKEKESRRAEGPEEDDEDDADKKPDGKKARKAKKAEEDKDDESAEDDDDDPDAEDDDDREKAARKAERARCEKIFSCGAAGIRPDMAAHLAFRTGMSATSAISMLESIAAGQSSPSGRRSLSERMSAVSTPNPGVSGNLAAPDLAAQIVQAGKVRRGEI